MCVVYCSSSETVSHLFMHCSAVNYISSKFFEKFGENWVCFEYLHQFLLIKFIGFRFHKQAKVLWQCSVFCYSMVSLVGKQCQNFKETSSFGEHLG